MGPQPSALNCKTQQTDKNNQITTSKQFFVSETKAKNNKLQNDVYQTDFPAQSLMGTKSPQLTRAVSDNNVTSKSGRHTVKLKTFIPEHQCITKVSQTPFRSCAKQKKYYVEQKLKSLGEIVEARYNTTKHFPYSQILGLTESLVYSLAYLAKKNCNHHDFHPSNIYYTQGKFKIINPLQVQASGFYLTSQRQRFSFLSPQLIIHILEQTAQSEVGHQMMNRSDVFSIGMILLQICSLQPSSECYDQESYNIIDSIIKERIHKVSKIYTHIMAEFVNLMLQYQVQRRLHPIPLAQLLNLNVQNEKIIAIQMQSQKTQGIGQQTLQNKPPGSFSNMIPPQQMINRGPPPPPYNHQPFKLQNLNQNAIAVTVPNEVFTRIGPNNQGFLSSSSLQQKLRVIELIKQNPNEEDSEGQHQTSLQQSEIENYQRSNENQVNTNNKIITNNQIIINNQIKATNQISTNNLNINNQNSPYIQTNASSQIKINNQNSPYIQTNASNQISTNNLNINNQINPYNQINANNQNKTHYQIFTNNQRIPQIQKQTVIPQYPFVQSIYCQKPPIQQPSDLENNNILKTGTIPMSRQILFSRPLLKQKQQLAKQLAQQREPMLNKYQKRTYASQQQTYASQQQTYASQQRTYASQQRTYASQQRRVVPTVSNGQPYLSQTDRQAQPKSNQTQLFGYGMPTSTSLNLPKHPPGTTSIHTSVQGSTLSYRQKTNITNQSSPRGSGLVYTRYGTSFQTNTQKNSVQSLDQRVQRVLNMSRNAK